MTSNFSQKLEAIQKKNQSVLTLMINPVIIKMPGLIQKYDEPFLPFGKAIINATHDLVCAYTFDLATYLSIGAAGAIALERTIAYAPNEIVTILHGPFSNPDYTLLMEEISFGVDAITITQPHETFSQRDDRAVILSQNGEFILPGNLKLHIVGEQVLYAAKGEDFATHVRNKLEKIRNEQ